MFSQFRCFPVPLKTFAPLFPFLSPHPDKESRKRVRRRSKTFPFSAPIKSWRAENKTKWKININWIIFAKRLSAISFHLGGKCFPSAPHTPRRNGTSFRQFLRSLLQNFPLTPSSLAARRHSQLTTGCHYFLMPLITTLYFNNNIFE